jgi:hypothetical protein
MTPADEYFPAASSRKDQNAQNDWKNAKQTPRGPTTAGASN